MSPLQQENPSSDAYAALVEEHQPMLRGFILSLVGDPHAAADIQQETNLVLWRKASDFEMGTSFKSWAFRIAHFQTLAYRQRLQRNRIILDDELISTMAEEAEEEPAYPEEETRRLNLCLSKLPDRQREAIKRRYLHAESVPLISGELGIPANAVSQLLHRARTNLARCMRPSQAASR